jgi:DNA polymerase-3 subunit epsilon
MNDFIAIDFETATHSPESAIAIALVKYRNYKPVCSYYSLIRPPRLYVRPDFTKIHGLKIADVKDAPDFKYLWENEISGFFKTAPFAAHNAQFDMNVLYSTLAWYHIPAPKTSCFCSLELSRRAWPELPSHSLSALAAEFGIQYNAHNALADAETCGKIISLCASSESRSSGRKHFMPVMELWSRFGLKLRNKNLLDKQLGNLYGKKIK